MTKSVYIDTSVVSYLTARPTRDMRTATRQVETIEWWTMESRHFDLFSSEVAIEEARRGNADAAKRRVEVLREMTILTLNDDAVELALALVAGRAVPAEAKVDADHIAIATVNNIDYILTWNLSHIANSVTIPIISEICEREGYNSPIITIPSLLRGGLDNGR